MSTAEMRAQSIYNTMHLSNIDDEVKRHLVILLMKVPESKEKKSFTSMVKSLSGAWKDNGLTAEEEIKQIYSARTSGETRKLVDL